VEERDDGTLVTFAGDEARPSICYGDRRRGGRRRRAGRPGAALGDGLVTLGAMGWGLVGSGSSPWCGWSAEAVNTTPPRWCWIRGAFGSGEHGSTAPLFHPLERLLQPGDLVLDLGSRGHPGHCCRATRRVRAVGV
jgi:hypothetical protein